jgi:hypothetical protein
MTPSSFDAARVDTFRRDRSAATVAELRLRYHLERVQAELEELRASDALPDRVDRELRRTDIQDRLTGALQRACARARP